MICPSCKKQIPDDAEKCQYCGSDIDHKDQVSREISFRRYQRWFFYAVLILLFIGMIGIIVRIYNANAELSKNMATVQDQLEQRQQKLEETSQNLEEKEQTLQQRQQELDETKSTLEEKDKKLSEKQQQLQEKTQQLQSELEEKTEIKEEYQDCQLDLTKADSNIYKLIVELGQGVSNNDLARIPLADSNLDTGEDSDGDGLSDTVEEALGTDPNKEDTDGDGYSDKEEVLGGFDPTGEGNIPVDENYAAQMKGKILLQVDNNDQAWYVGGNGKRYFLGTPSDAYSTMRQVEYWTENPPEDSSSNDNEQTSTSATKEDDEEDGDDEEDSGGGGLRL
jgi:Skp family chaperone for outer membrane proteins